MWLRHLSILNFKNIAEADLDLCSGVNCLVGSNGMGKSNLLEAVYYLSMTRSFLRLPDSELMRHGTESMMVKGDYRYPDGRELPVSIGYAPPRRKSLKRGGKEYKKFSEHIGTIPVVSISPQDHFLITGSPEERRRLMDTVISQGDPVYLDALVRYGGALQGRNSMLRSGMADPILMEGVEMQLDRAASLIHESRKSWVSGIAEPFAKYYAAVSGQAEAPGIEYSSALSHTTLSRLLRDTRAKDLAIGHTTEGVHRDDLRMSLGSHDLRRLGSQGQIKTYTIALRLAIFEYLTHRSGMKPILLLDDIFDKLDATRVANIMRVVSDADRFGQIFITDTGREHIDAILDHVPGSHSLIQAEHGKYTTLKSTPEA